MLGTRILCPKDELSGWVEVSRGVNYAKSVLKPKGGGAGDLPIMMLDAERSFERMKDGSQE